MSGKRSRIVLLDPERKALLIAGIYAKVVTLYLKPLVSSRIIELQSVRIVASFTDSQRSRRAGNLVPAHKLGIRSFKITVQNPAVGDRRNSCLCGCALRGSRGAGVACNGDIIQQHTVLMAAVKAKADTGGHNILGNGKGTGHLSPFILGRRRFSVYICIDKGILIRALLRIEEDKVAEIIFFHTGFIALDPKCKGILLSCGNSKLIAEHLNAAGGCNIVHFQRIGSVVTDFGNNRSRLVATLAPTCIFGVGGLEITIHHQIGRRCR